MKVYPEEPTGRLSEALGRTLQYFRTQRAFDARQWVRAKCTLLNEYLRTSGLSACVVAVSGGVDSALVLALACHAAKQNGSPLKRIVPVCLPVRTPGAASGQPQATERALALIDHLGLTGHVIDLSAAHQAVKDATDAALGVKGENWASGQLAATVRTPAYYYVTSVLSEQGFPAVVLGTTNRDEGSYLGYVGKASDAIVDIQLIADLHKSEVYKAARTLRVTEEILSVAPAGDMYDGRADVEVFGASYDALELHLSLLEAPEFEKTALMSDWGPSDQAQYAQIAKNLDALHAYNGHKYLTEWPGVFLNVLPSAIPGGWQVGPRTPRLERPSTVDTLSGLITLPEGVIQPDPLLKGTPKSERLFKNPVTQLSATHVLGLLQPEEIYALLASLCDQAWFPVGTSGYEHEYTPGNAIGSYRLRAYDVRLAEELWRRLKPLLGCCELTAEGALADAKGIAVWRPVGVSPLFRFIRYAQGGSLVAHYDSPYQYSDHVMSLKSLVLYLTDRKIGEGGETRFIHDAQDRLDPLQRNYADWPRSASADEALTLLAPRAGDALVFDHRLLHDSAPLRTREPKIIVRTDILYQAICPPCTGKKTH